MNSEVIIDIYQRIDGLFDILGDAKSRIIRRKMRDILITMCAESLRNLNQTMGNLFIQIDYLCKYYNVSRKEKFEIQQVRRHTLDKSLKLEISDYAYDLKVLTLFVKCISHIDAPISLLEKLPTEDREIPSMQKVNCFYIRCVVQSMESEGVFVTTEQNHTDNLYVNLSWSQDKFLYLKPLLHIGSQLNLLNCIFKDNVITPQFVVLEPDYMMDISTIAGCFNEYGHHPFSFLLSKMKMTDVTQPILLGNFASSALDDILHSKDLSSYKFSNTLIDVFKEHALEFSSCDNFDAEKFKKDSATQSSNLVQTVNVLSKNYDINKAILEPSFVCEHLGVQGRVDLMTNDFSLLVEQKSGKNFLIEKGYSGEKGVEKHIVQVLLYFGILHENFCKSVNDVDVRLLYSKYAPPFSLVAEKFVSTTANGETPSLAETLKFRNLVVALMFYIAEHGFSSIIEHINPNVLNQRNKKDRLFLEWQLPEIVQQISVLKSLTDIERRYFCRMVDFIVKEQILSKVGKEEGRIKSHSDIWNMPLSKKQEAGDIYIGLTIKSKEKSKGEANGYDIITLNIPDQGEDFLPNFRQGDMVYLYSYQNSEPNACRSFLFSCVLIQLSSNELVVKLGDGQQNPDMLNTVVSFDETYGKCSVSIEDNPVFAIEHAAIDASVTTGWRSLYSFVSAPVDRRNLLLSQREPSTDEDKTLNRNYDDSGESYYNDILLREKQAKDYFLLIGPPGTGKTHRAIRYMVEEELSDGHSNILLMAYTNRAVDEICSMLTYEIGVQYLRLGKTYGCDENYRSHLLSNAFNGDSHVKLSDLKQKIMNTRVFVSTVSYLLSKSYVFSLKHFSLAIVDESSQIIESDLVGILASHQKDKNQCDIDRFVLVGDYKQMPAVVLQDYQTSKVSDDRLNEIGLKDCRLSLFQRLVMRETEKGRSSFIGVLRKQGRMHPAISEFPNRMFYSRENIDIVPCPHQLEDSLGYSGIPESKLDELLFSQRMLFLSIQAQQNIELTDKVNIAEAQIVANIVLKIYELYGAAFDSQKTLGIIVPYRNQIAMIRKALKSILLSKKIELPILDELTIDTVERFQGSQRDVIIYSFTVRYIYQLDFLTASSFMEKDSIIDPKLNVAITRARKQLILLGDEMILRNNPLFSSLIDFVKNKGGYMKID